MYKEMPACGLFFELDYIILQRNTNILGRIAGLYAQMTALEVTPQGREPGPQHRSFAECSACRPVLASVCEFVLGSCDSGFRGV